MMVSHFLLPYNLYFIDFEPDMNSMPDLHAYEIPPNEDNQGAQQSSDNQNMNDSLQENEGEICSDVDQKSDNFESGSNNSDAINDHLEEVKDIFENNKESDDMFSPQSHMRKVENIHDANMDEFMKEIEDTENQFKRLQEYNTSFNHDISNKYPEMHQVPSDNDSYNGSYNPSENTTEGNLSRDNDSPPIESLQNPMVEVSPDSNIDDNDNLRLSVEDLFQQLSFRDPPFATVSSDNDDNQSSLLEADLENRQQVLDMVIKAMQAKNQS
jgi:hypothetical protein